MMDLGMAARLHACFTGALPRVAPFYAVKCMPEPGLLRMLAALGAGFDCASTQELAAVLGMGVPPARIIYAHPVKPPAQARLAAHQQQHCVVRSTVVATARRICFHTNLLAN